MGLNTWLRSRKHTPSSQDARRRATWKKWFRPLIETLEDRLAPATMYALTNANALLTFDSATPGTITNNQTITNLQPTEQIVGIDVRPATGQLYGFGLVDDGATRTGRIYTINPTTAVATPVGAAPWTNTYPDTEFGGFNFNPNVDLIRIISRNGPNFRVSPNTGALVGTDTNTSIDGINGVAYTNNDGFAATTTLYGLNFDDDDLVTVGGLNGVPSPNTGQVFTIGDTGIIALDASGLEIVSSGGMASAFATANGNFYTVNLGTGLFTLVGAIGGAPSILGLTAALPNTIAVGGTAGPDTLVVNATGVNSGTYSLNGGAAVAFSGVTSFAFIGGAGDDTLTINNPAGALFAPTGGIRYHGGGQAGDSLSILGGSATSGSYTPGPGSADGVISHVGAATQTLTFTGLAPIIDTVAEGTFTINGNDAANAITVDNGTSAVDGLIRVAIDAFEPISFANKTNVTVNGGLTAADVADTIAINFTEAGTGLTALTVNGGAGADAFAINVVAGRRTNLNGDAGADSFTFANGASLSGGTIDGGTEVDTLDHSAAASAVSVNLGLNASLFATLQADQEVPPNLSTPTGVGTVTFDPVANTINVVVAVSGLAPALVTGFHIHRGPFAVNGPVIVDFAGNTNLVPDGMGGFTFNGTFPMPAGHEAAFIGGITYINVHTATFPGGIIRGQLFSNGNIALATGTATGTGGISNIETALGGAGNDSLVGNLSANVLTGNAGNDTIVGGPGADIMAGNAGTDTIVWANGDGSDIIDGGTEVDTVQVNGSPAGNDVFTVGPNGTRVDFDRISPGPFSLDIGTTETLIVAGIGGTDSFTVSSLAGVADLTTITLGGLDANDTFDVVPQTITTINVNGHLPRVPATPGDTLNFNALGLAVTATATSFQAAGRQPVNFVNVETINLSNVTDLVINATGANDTLIVNATDANSGTYVLNGGVPVAFTGITSLTFNGLAGDDLMRINNPAGGLFAPTGGVFYNGGGQAADSIENLGGTADEGTYSVGPATGDGVITHTLGGVTQTITFTGLAPALDTVAEATFTINATDAANAITLDNGAANGDGRLRVSIDAFEPITFSNKTTVEVNGDLTAADGADTVLVNYTEASTGLTNVIINTGAGPDTANVQATPAGVTTRLNMGDDSDTVNVSSDAPANTGTLDALDGLLELDSGDTGGTDVLNISESGLATADTVTVNTGNTPFEISGTSGGGWNITEPVNAFGGGINLFLGSAGDTVDVESTFPGEPVNIFAGAGDDVITVGITSLADVDAPVTIEGEDGNDTVTVDFLGADVIDVEVVFNGGGQTGMPGDTLNVVGINTTTVTKTFLPQAAGNNGNIDVGGSLITYTGLEPITLDGTMVDLIINLPTGDGDNQAIIEDDGDPANGISQIRSGNGSFETTTFTNPTGTLTLNTGDDGETVTIDVLDDAYAAATTVNGGAAQDTFLITPAPLAAMTINGGPPTAVPGDTLVVDIAGTINPTLTITNVNGNSLDGNYTFDNRGTVSFTNMEQVIPQGADLEVTKTDAPDPVIAGTNLTYTITVTNNGLLTSQDVQLTDATPFNSTFVSFTQNTGPAFTLTNPGVGNSGFVTATIAELQPGQTATFTFVVLVGANVPNATTLTNTATVLSLTTPDPVPGNNLATTDTLVNTSADLQVTKSDNPEPATAGENLTYTITVINNGPSDAQTVTLSDLVPANTTFVSAAQNSGPAFTLTTPPVGGTGLFTGTIGTLAAGAIAMFTFVVNVNANTPNGTTLDNTASVLSAITADPNLLNNADTELTAVVTETDIVVTKTDTPDPVIAGQNITYTITVTNAGPSDSGTVIFTDSVPAFTTFVSMTQGSGPAFTLTTPPVGGGGLITGTIASLAAGASATFTLVLNVGASTPDATVVSNTVTALTGSPDPDLLNNIATATTTVTNQADLELDKTGPLAALAGTQVTYTVTVTNNGPNAAPSVDFTDILPAFTTFVSAMGLSNVMSVGGVVTGTLGPIASGANTVVTITVLVDAATPFFTTITNSATVTVGTPGVVDPDLTNNTDDASTIIITQADIQVTKVDGADPVVAGTNLTYTITLTNAGPSDAQSVVLSDAVPPGTTFVSLAQNSGPAFALSAPAVGGTGNVTATAATLAAGATATFTLVVRVNASTPQGATISNTANAFSGTADSNVANNLDTETTAVIAQADLSVTKTDTPDPVLAGNDITYTITVTNSGPSDAQAVNLSDLIPTNTTFVSAAQNSGPAFTLVTPPVGGTGTFTATTVTLAAGATATFTLVVNVNSNVFTGSTITNTANITSATTDTDPSDNSATATTLVNTEADIVVTKTDTPDPVTAGTNLTYTIMVTNNGPSDAVAVTLTDAIPTGTTFVSFTAPAGWSSNTPVVGGTGTLNSFVTSLASGATATFTLVVQVGAAVLQGTTLSNTANASSLITPDPTPGNNSDTETTAVIASADLAITKTDLPDPVLAGEQLTYTLTVTNVGPSDAQTVSLGDLLPTGTTFVSMTAPAGWVLTTPAVGGTGLVSATIATLAAGVAPQVFTLVVLVGANVPGGTTISNTATIISLTDDPVLSNNNATSITGVNAEADLVVTKTDSPDPVIAGTNLTYTVAVLNDGPSDAQNVQFLDTLPTGVTFVSATASNGATLNQAGGVVTGTLGTIAAGATVTVTIVVTVPANTAEGATLSNTASANGATVDPNPANNTDTETTTVDTEADIAVTKTDSPDPVIAGTNLTYTILVTNNGPSDAQNVIFTDNLPAGTTFVSATTSQGTVSGGGTVATGTLGTVAAGATVTITVVASVPASTPNGTTLSNTATANSNTDDPTPANNTDTETTAVITQANVGIVQSGLPNPAVAGGPVTYTITVTNAGPSDAQTVVVNEAMPANTTLISFTQTSGPTFALTNPGFGNNGPVTATIATLASGATAVFSLQVRLASNAAQGSSITKTGTITTTTTDPTPGNNTATATLPVTNPEIIAVGQQFGSSEVRVFDALTQAQQLDIPVAFEGFLGGVRTAATDLTGDGFDDVVVGAAFAHAGGHVKVFDGRTGALLRSFLAFEGYIGDIFVGGGDVNGDGIGDIIVGAGAGSVGGHVKVFSGVDNSLIRSFLTYEGYIGGVRVAGGDVNGDGRADIITGVGPGANSHVKVFSGGNGALLASFFTFAGYTGGVFVGAQDINGDGRADVLVGADAGAGGGHVKVIDGTRLGQVNADGSIADSALLGSFFSQAADFTGGARVSGGVFTGGTAAAVVTGPGGPSSPVVQLFTGTQFAFPAPLEAFLGLDADDDDGIFVG